jgi:hypothetical protein
MSIMHVFHAHWAFTVSPPTRWGVTILVVQRGPTIAVPTRLLTLTSEIGEPLFSLSALIRAVLLAALAAKHLTRCESIGTSACEACEGNWPKPAACTHSADADRRRLMLVQGKYVLHGQDPVAVWTAAACSQPNSSSSSSLDPTSLLLVSS